MREGINLLESASPTMISEMARQCWNEMDSNQSIVITAHRSPDGDAVGAALGFHHHLKAMGLTTSVVLPDRFPSFLNWMPGADGIRFYDEETESATQLLHAADVIWCLDFNGLDRVGKMEEALREAPGRKWVVDHHQLPDDFADCLLSDPTCGSTCELLVDLIVGWGQGELLTHDAMACFYVGIMTDTGSFRFPSVTAHTHAVLAHFLSRGLEHASIHQKTFDEQSLNRVQLQGFAMSQRLHVFNDYGLAIVGLERADLNRFHYESGDTEGLVNKILGLAGVGVAIMAREAEPGLIKLSLRSVGDFSVRDLAAAEFGGGGHKNAAGGVVKGMSMPQFIEFVSTRLSDWFNAGV
jgi:phosphoesterase RecJ-like protein